MSSRPWEADRSLSLKEARAAVAEQFPKVDASSMQLIGSGWQFDAFLTSDGWLFRFPRQAWCADLFGPEQAVHDLVARVLPEGIAVPRVQLLGEAGPAFPYAFAGHRFIVGVPADEAPFALRRRMATGIGLALSAIHSIPEEHARAIGVCEVDPNEEWRRQWLERGIEGAGGLVGLHPAVDHAVRWMSDLRWPVHRYDGPLRFIHQDLSPEHFVIEPSSGRLAGILDWTDAALGDPARDFVTLVTFAGWAFALDVLANYTAPLDATFQSRLRILAQLLSVIWLVEARARDEDVAKGVKWVANAFSPLSP